ncbi:hypothetical protein FMEAI12_4110014 [Parafrankia sp. Ea1.12]|nr:hypothetical protein FMEAI12_4110014 [Parafrankia sp. Ea1.12]
MDRLPTLPPRQRPRCLGQELPRIEGASRCHRRSLGSWKDHFGRSLLTRLSTTCGSGLA